MKFAFFSLAANLSTIYQLKSSDDLSCSDEGPKKRSLKAIFFLEKFLFRHLSVHNLTHLINSKTLPMLIEASESIE